MRKGGGIPVKTIFIPCRFIQVGWLKSSASPCLLRVVDDEGSRHAVPTRGHQMSTKKRIAAVAITIAALTAGSAGVASAHDGVNKGLVKATVLADLVKAGTITQAQADAISKKFDEVRAAKQAERAAKRAERAAKQAANPNKVGKHGKGAKVSNG